MKTEAKCPECGQWSEIVDTTPRFCFAMWEWKKNKSADCPHCGYLVLFESECDFREVK